MGGAQSHDIADGILDMESSDFYGQYDSLCRKSWAVPYQPHFHGGRRNCRPTRNTPEAPWQTLERLNWKVDYIITLRTDSNSAENQRRFQVGQAVCTAGKKSDAAASSGHWLFGHYHGQTELLMKKYVLLYEQMVRVL
ncbi:MAG: hypothetical protein ACLU3I_08615 [Acutalibacteraceae bacterium]